jgi:hypothetical protein
VGLALQPLLAAAGHPSLIIRPEVDPCDQLRRLTDIANGASLDPDDLEMIARWATTSGAAIVTSDASA